MPKTLLIQTGKDVFERQELGAVDAANLPGMDWWPLDQGGNRLLKRATDIAGAVAGLLMGAPVIALLAVLVKCSSPGPAFYRQTRCGRSERPFTLYKLRSMHVDAEARCGPVWAHRDDPRRTPLGAFMRRYDLDELPQLWNVLKGDMSLVGPRPERPHFVERFSRDLAGYRLRHRGKPGMTGWAQVNGFRGDTSLEARVRHDLFYLQNWSIAFDIRILARTFLARHGAY